MTKPSRTQMQHEFVLRSDHLDALLSAHASSFPKPTDFLGYRNHCFRMLNVVLRLSNDEPDRQSKVEIALAFHDLTIFPDRSLAYLDGAVRLAHAHLRATHCEHWTDLVTLMIQNHHKVRAYSGPEANLVEAFRRADWIDVTFGFLSFDLDRAWVRALHEELPLYTFYPRTLVPLIASYIAKHPRRPLPNFRW